MPLTVLGRAILILWILPFLLPVIPSPAAAKEGDSVKFVKLDFENVDLSVLVKSMSLMTGKNFVIDERVKGKVTLYSPTKIAVDRVYQVFLSVLEMKGYSAIPSGDVIQILPDGDAPSERNVNVYYLENANAEDLAKVLAGFANKPPGARARPGGAQGAESGIQIYADKGSNALIIAASPRDYQTMKSVIEKLDVKRRQVFVEAAIVEIGEDTLREIGVELTAPLRTDSAGNISDKLGAIGGTNFGGITQAISGPEGLAGLSGLALGAIKGTFTFKGQEFLNIGALVRALQSDASVNVLSTPQLMTSDNQKAEIVVGQNVPFVTGQSQTTGGNVITTIERRDVGITLRITPQILEDDRVKLELYQEISSLTPTAQSVGTLVVGPTTNKRSASTTVIVNDRQTIVIGGLIKDNLTVSENKVPFLGDIPLLGWLFKFHSKRVEKSNLIIFLTPSVITDAGQLAALRESKTDAAADFIERNRLGDSEKVRRKIEEATGGSRSAPTPPAEKAPPSANGGGEARVTASPGPVPSPTPAQPEKSASPAPRVIPSPMHEEPATIPTPAPVPQEAPPANDRGAPPPEFGAPHGP